MPKIFPDQVSEYATGGKIENLKRKTRGNVFQSGHAKRDVNRLKSSVLINHFCIIFKICEAITILVMIKNYG